MRSSCVLFRQRHANRARCRLFSSSLPALVICAPLIGAQATTANPVTKAADAFGFRNGDESIGIYNESTVRGFSLEAAGNFRLNGTYFVKSSGVSNFFLENRTVRIGINTLNTTLPGPSGVVDFQLRDPARGEPGLYTVGLDEFNQAYAEAFYRHRDRADRYSLAVGSSVVFRAADKQGGHGNSTLFAGTSRFRLGARGRVHVFGGEYDYQRSGSMVVTTTDAVLPGAIVRGQYLGQTWAQESGARRIAGALTDWRLGPRWSMGTTSVFSQEDPERAFTQLFAFADRTTRARSQVVAAPHQQFTAWSGEVRAIRTVDGVQLQHRLTLVLRGRASRNRFGGERVLDLGDVSFGTRGADLPAPDLASARATLRNTVDQWGVGASYQLSWRERTSLSAGVLRTDYAREFIAATGARARAGSTPVLFNLGLRRSIAQRTDIYATWSRGLEDAGVAPSAAANRGTPLDAITVSQVEAGMRQRLATRITLIVATFNTRKPYAGLDASTGVYSLVGDVNHRGIEASLAGQPWSGVSIVLGAVAMQPLLTLRTDSTRRNTRAVGVPSLRWIANANWSVPHLTGLSLDLGSEFTGATPAKATPVALSAAQPTLPATLVTNIGARARVRVVGVYLNIRAQTLNVFNRAYWTVNSSETFDFGAQRRYRLLITAER
jgi:iron complex outermembrane recepter protein